LGKNNQNSSQTQPIIKASTSQLSSDIKKISLSDVPVPELNLSSFNSSVKQTATSSNFIPSNVDWTSLQQEEQSKTSKSNESSIPLEMVSAPPAIDWASLQQSEKSKRLTQKVNESSGEIFSELDKAMKLVEKATAEEMSKNYVAALSSYKESLSSFLFALESEHNPDIKKAISDKMTQYISRAELIKDALKVREARPQSTTFKKESSKEPKIKDPPKTQKVEVSLTAQSFVEAGIQAAEQAVELDECCKYEEAIVRYDEALQFFTAALQNETNFHVKSIIKEKMVYYNTRVEQLRQYKSTGNFVPTPIKLGLKEGEKYKPPEIKKKSGGLFSKKEKKTWD